MANHHLSLALLAAALAAGAPSIVFAQAPAAATSAAAAAPIPPEEMEKLVGPIALYPDDLVSVILPASTNPLQIVQADRWLDARKANPKLPIEDKWDDPVKTLLNYPDVVKKMSKDLDWTAALGEAVVADTGAVLEGVQAFRRRAQAAGNLKTDSKQTVVIEQEVVKIAPANPEVIYVPQYEPTAVVVAGYSAWGYWPTAYPSYYYPYAPGAAFATGLIWGAAIGAAWSGGRYASHYGGNANINVNRNTNINTGNIGSGNRGGGNTATQWKSNKSPGQVSSSVGSSRGSGARAGDSSFGGGAGAGNRGGGAGGGAGSAARPSQGGGGNAFGGYDSGRQTSMDSSRGASSRSSSGMSDRGGGGGSRASSGGGASRGSMGGGSRGGGGGGRRR